MPSSTKKSLSAAVTTINNGGVIAYPTEGVWGLGCDPWNRKAVEKILAIKNRPVEKGLILIAGDSYQVEPLLAPLPRAQRKRLNISWPGPFTWLIPDIDSWAPSWVRGQHDTVAVRVTAHPLVRELCMQWGKPLVSTSANRAGGAALRTEQEVVSLLGDEVDMVLPGETSGLTSPSRICDLRTGKVLRS